MSLDETGAAKNDRAQLTEEQAGCSIQRISGGMMNLTAWKVLGIAVLAAGTLAKAQEPKVENAGQMKFVPVPDAPKCFTMSVVEGDPSKGPSTFVLRGTPGCDAPMHYHTPTERVVLVSGTAYLQMKGDPEVHLLKAGAYAVAPPKHPHHITCTGGCEIYLFSDAAFDIHWVNDKGEEIPLAAAQKASKKLGPGHRAAKTAGGGD